MTYAYDAIAMAQPSALDPYRVATTLAFQTTRDEDDVLVDADTLVLEGPRGAREFASMYALYCQSGIMADKLADVMAVRIGTLRDRGIASPAGQRQILAILRWLLACAGYGEDVFMAAMVAALESRGGWPTVGEIMAHTPHTIETIEWSRHEPPRDSTPIEWLE